MKGVIIVMWLLLIIIIAFVYYSNNGSFGTFSIGKKDPDELLRERFVKGEIDESKYLQMKETLKK